MSKDNVIFLNTFTTHDIPPERVIAEASHLCPVMVIGIEPDGEYYFASSTNDAWSLHIMLKKALDFLERNAEPVYQKRKDSEDN